MRKALVMTNMFVSVFPLGIGDYDVEIVMRKDKRRAIEREGCHPSKTILVIICPFAGAQDVG